jgi:hypothetical protein
MFSNRGFPQRRLQRIDAVAVLMEVAALAHQKSRHRQV